MPTTRLIQVSSYITPALKKLLDKEIAAAVTRRSVSAHIESILKQHYDKQLTA